MNGQDQTSRARRFAGWNRVAEILRRTSREEGARGWSLNDGQRRSLRALAQRLPRHGAVIADEVGMGKTRIAVALAGSVVEAGGRVAILIPSGLGFQWQKELRDGGVPGVDFLRSLHAFTRAARRGAQGDAAPWFQRDIVLVSHGLMNWRLGESSKTWRWALLPALHARLQGDDKLERRLMAHGQNLEADWERELLPHVFTRASEIAACLEQPDAPEELSARKYDIFQHAVTGNMLEPESYGNQGGRRLALQQTLGLGLGVFDLVITDEAHKSRGETSGLSTLLEKVIVASSGHRRISMTATPVELDQQQWRQALERIGVCPDTIGARDGGDIFASYLAASQRLRDMPHSPQAREAYAGMARQFQDCLSPYVLRRDKREMPEIKAFEQLGRKSGQSYRAFGKIEVEPCHLSPGWKQAICAVEALSIAARQAEDSVAKRLRLTMGNGHGIAALLDQAAFDKEADKEQHADDGDIAAIPTGSDPKRLQRIGWWKQMIGQAFGASDPLYQHPATTAAIDAIETIIGHGRKVLVFGRFTLPMRALVQMLNARAMLRALDAGEAWPQAIIHDEDWPAIEIAHRAIRKVPVDRDALKAELARQYEALEYQRRRRREALPDSLRASLAESPWLPVFHAFENAQNSHKEAKGLTPLALLDHALEASGLGEKPSDKALAGAFIHLIETVLHRESEEDEPVSINADTARTWWQATQDHLAEEFSPMRGGFARLMNGGTKQQTRRLMQLSFNRAQSFPRVLVAQSVVGREGLNLHEACRDVVLLHPEWNPGVVEQQIGRVDRVGSLWAKDMNAFLARQQADGDIHTLPQISVQSVIFRGTYDETNWMTLEKRWDALRATLHGIVISDDLARRARLSATDIEEINALAPNFAPIDTPAA